MAIYGDGALDLFGIDVSGPDDINGDGMPAFAAASLNGGAACGGYVRVYTSQVPEPAFAGLAGFLGLGLRRRTKRYN